MEPHSDTRTNQQGDEWTVPAPIETEDERQRRMYLAGAAAAVVVGAGIVLLLVRLRRRSDRPHRMSKAAKRAAGLAAAHALISRATKKGDSPSE